MSLLLIETMNYVFLNHTTISIINILGGFFSINDSISAVLSSDKKSELTRSYREDARL